MGRKELILDWRMDTNELKSRTAGFALQILKLVDQLPVLKSNYIISNQIGRSATGVAANYRAACKARTYKEFVAKLGTVVEEADETLYWLELLEQLNQGNDEVVRLKTESNELVSIFSAALKTARAKLNAGNRAGKM